jgi:26S proteasome regulatory subunit N1
MVDVIVPFNVAHNSEAEAVDLLIEVQRLKKVLDLDSIDEKNYRRVCMYLIKTADFMSDPDDYAVSFWTCYNIECIYSFVLRCLSPRVLLNHCSPSFFAS